MLTTGVRCCRNRFRGRRRCCGGVGDDGVIVVVLLWVVIVVAIVGVAIVVVFAWVGRFDVAQHPSQQRWENDVQATRHKWVRSMMP